MITKESTIVDIYSDPILIKYVDNLYFGWGYKEDTSKIGDLCPDVWPNDEIVSSLNYLKELDKQGDSQLLVIDENNPSISLISLTHNDNGKCALVYAGGGYSSVCNAIEALPVAVDLYKKGFNVFVGTYGILENARNGKAIKDVCNAIKYLFKNQENLNIDMNNYIIGGFSAGGHVVAELLTDNFGFRVNNIPQAGLMFLGYPVITFDETTACKMNQTLLGNTFTQKDLDGISIDKHLDNYGLKVFFWQCTNDNIIGFKHALNLERAIKKTNNPYIFKSYESSAHGWGIAKGKLADGWIDEMLTFYNK